jgi:hypothetical protein
MIKIVLYILLGLFVLSILGGIFKIAMWIGVIFACYYGWKNKTKILNFFKKT